MDFDEFYKKHGGYEEDSSNTLTISDSFESLQAYKKMEELYKGGLSTGFAVLDKYFRFIPEHVYVLAAATHIGKTSLALNFAQRVAEKHNVLFASFEQGFQIVPRILSIGKTEILPSNLYLIAPYEIPSIQALEQTVHDTEDKPKLLIIDHIHYFERGRRGLTEEISELIMRLQMLARKEQIPVVVVAHVRKLNADRPPTIDDLKDTSALAQVPSVVCFLHRARKDLGDALGGEGIYEDKGFLFISKNRVFGKTGAEPFYIQENGTFVFNKEGITYEDKLSIEGF
jgi:replicative DNA helicase